MRRLVFSSFSLAALVACSSTDGNTGPSLADPATLNTKPSQARGGHSTVTRPLSGRCTTVVTRLAPPPIEMQSIEYTCRISHLGLTHAVTTQTVNVATGEISSFGEFVAANGDRLNVTFSGNATPNFINPTEVIVSFEGTERFSPGTGRFSDATGTADLSGTAHINLITGAGTGEFTLEGELTY